MRGTKATKKLKRIKKSRLQKKREDPFSRLWRNKADKAWRDVVFTTGNGQCAICGKKENVQAHHLIPRQMATHRHDRMNGILLCAGHHKYSFELSPHKAPVEFVKWMLQHRPGQWAWALTQYPRRSPEVSYMAVHVKLAALLEKFHGVDDKSGEQVAVEAGGEISSISACDLDIE